jgi:CheY-like chemotaxis protein
VALRCLLVDDNSDFLEAARELLECEGFEVVGAVRTGSEAKATAAALQPDVILLDLYLGDESGFDVARQLVDAGQPPYPAIILISTYAEADLADLVAESPAVGFLSKACLSRTAIRSTLGLGTE